MGCTAHGFVTAARAFECNRRLTCAGTKVAVHPPMDSRDPNNPTPLIPAADWTISAADAPAPAVVPAKEKEQPATARLPWMVVAVVIAIAASVAGVVAALVFIGVRPQPVVATTPPAVTASAASSPIADSSPAPTWTGARRASWANDGSKTIAFTLASTRDVPVWMSYARPVLAVRCMYKSTEVFVVLDTSAGFEEADRRTVRVQWDDEPVSTEQWGVSETGRELFAPDGVGMLRRLAGARQLRFGFTPFNAQPVTADFAVQGFDQLAGLVASTCGWRLEDRVAAR